MKTSSTKTTTADPQAPAPPAPSADQQAPSAPEPTNDQQAPETPAAVAPAATERARKPRDLQGEIDGVQTPPDFNPISDPSQIEKGK